MATTITGRMIQLYSSHLYQAELWAGEIAKFHRFGVQAPAAYYRYLETEKEAAEQILEKARSVSAAA
jgi:hypothetical protein